MERKDIIINYELYHREKEKEFELGVASAREQVTEDLVQLIEGEANLCRAVLTGRMLEENIPKQDPKNYEIIQRIEKAIMSLRKSRI